MNGTPATSRGTAYLRRHLISLGIVIAVAMLLALVGAFGTFQLGGLVSRLSYWLASIIPGYLIFAPVVEGTAWAARKLDLPYWTLLLPGELLACVPMTLIVWYLGMRAERLPSEAEFAALYGNVAIVALLIGAVFWWRGRSDEPGDDDADAPSRRLDAHTEGADAELPEAAPPELAKRLQAGFGRVNAIESEDHYIRVHGDGRSELILMRLADAVAEMEGTPGLRVHRSWWVAADAVASWRREGRQAMLTLENGTQVPVSRANMAAAKAAGLLRAG